MMPIEVRQLIIKSTVGSGPEDFPPAETAAPSVEALKEEILGECKMWLEEKLQQLRER